MLSGISTPCRQRDKANDGKGPKDREDDRRPSRKDRDSDSDDD